MLQYHVEAVAAALPRHDDLAGPWRVDRRGPRRGEIHPSVKVGASCDGVPAPPLKRAYAHDGERRARRRRKVRLPPPDCAAGRMATRRRGEG